MTTTTKTIPRCGDREVTITLTLDKRLGSESEVPNLVPGRPDYQLECRFNGFANLRYQVWAYVQRKHPAMKLATGVDTRKKLMATLCNEFLGVQETNTAILYLMERFLRKEEA
eukprot:jgi/Phyca11/17641/fgenesh1_pg.PHYCAscaffold_29_\